MSIELVTCDEHQFPHWGYYRHVDGVNRTFYKITRYLSARPSDTRVNGFEAFVFETGKVWWIGANFMDERDRFQLIGPFDDHECAYVHLKLIADPH